MKNNGNIDKTIFKKSQNIIINETERVQNLTKSMGQFINNSEEKLNKTLNLQKNTCPKYQFFRILNNILNAIRTNIKRIFHDSFKNSSNLWIYINL